MKMHVSVKLETHFGEVTEKVREAARLGFRDTAVAVHRDSVKQSPYLTGNNMRSITMEVSGIGANQYVDPHGIEAAIYSTSGYGGYLEAGLKTRRMDPRPYIRPAMEANKDSVVPNIRRHLAR